MRKFLLPLLAAIAVAFIIGYFMINKSHSDIASATPIYTGDVAGLKMTLDENAKAFDSIYVDQVILVEGTITNVGQKSFVLDHILYCEPDSTLSIDSFKRGDDIRIRGEVEGAEEDLIEGFIIRVGRVLPEPQ